MRRFEPDLKIKKIKFCFHLPENIPKFKKRLKNIIIGMVNEYLQDLKKNSRRSSETEQELKLNSSKVEKIL